MNYCPHCGNKIEESDTYCSRCGQKIEKNNGPVNLATKDYNNNKYESKQSPKFAKVDSSLDKPDTFHVLAKVFIVLSMIFLFPLIFPVIIGGVSLSKLNHANKKEDIIGMAVITLLFCSFIGGIVMLLIPDEEF